MFISQSEIEYLRKKEFHDTNKLWNDYCFNSTFNIGNLTYLYRKSKVRNYKDFFEWYIKDGEDRKKEIRKLKKNNQLELQTIKTKKIKIKDIKYSELNVFKGRTVDDLFKIAKEFQQKLKENGKELSLTKTYKYVFIRVFYETSLGVEKEYQVKENLEKLFPKLIFKEADTEKDIKYSLDLEVYKDEKQICGLQIKSYKYYISTTNINKEIKDMNREKHMKYYKDTNKKIYYIYYNKDSSIMNLDEIKKILSV